MMTNTAMNVVKGEHFFTVSRVAMKTGMKTSSSKNKREIVLSYNPTIPFLRMSPEDSVSYLGDSCSSMIMVVLFKIY